jgi:hypothetical protein
MMTTTCFPSERTFGPILVARAMLQNELALDQAKVYNPDEVSKIFELLVNSEGGYVPYEDVESRFGKVKIEAMIRRNILHYRPDSTFSRDLQPNPDFEVVSAIGVPALRAMEQLLERRRRRAAKQLHGPGPS